nr:reverse transcriptase domain-containing protein [Tanacetum cinerariifolium]
MRTRSQSRNNFPQQEASPAIIEPLRIELLFLEDQFQEDPPVDPPEVPMADNRTMAACPLHGFSKLHQLDTLYNALNVNDQNSLNSAAGGNFLDKMPRECLKIIKSKSKVHQSRAKAVVAKVSTSSSTPAISCEVSMLKDMVRALLLDKKNQSSAPAASSTPAPVKEIEPNYVTCGGAHSYQNCPATSENVYRDNIQDFEEYANPELRCAKPVSGTANPNSQFDGHAVQIRTKVTKDHVQTPSSQSIAPVQPPIIRSETQTPVSKPVIAPVSVSMPNLKPSIPYPSRRDNERRHDQANEQIEKFYEIFKEMSFEISFTDALIFMLKFASTLKALIGNKEKLSEMAKTPIDEHYSTVIVNKLPRKLGDPEKFLIPCKFPGIDECLALPDLDVSVKVGVFHFPADFVVVDFEPDPRVPLILGRCFLKTGRALIYVHKGELTLPIGNEAITYNLDQTVRYSANYNQMTTNKIDVICEMYSQEVLGFTNDTASGNPTPYDDPIVSPTSPTLTLFGDNDFLLFEEADAFLCLEDDPDSPKINPFYYDPEGDILLLEAILNSEPLPPLPNYEQYIPSYKKELKVCEAKTVKSSVHEPPEVKLKDLPPHLEYEFLEGDNNCPSLEIQSRSLINLCVSLDHHLSRSFSYKVVGLSTWYFKKVGERRMGLLQAKKGTKTVYWVWVVWAG